MITISQKFRSVMSLTRLQYSCLVNPRQISFSAHWDNCVSWNLKITTAVTIFDLKTSSHFRIS